MSKREYWLECVSAAAEECGVTLSNEQLESIAGSVESAHDNYGLAFYSPPASDRISVIEREFSKKLKDAQKETERIRSDFVKNVCMRNKCEPSEVVLDGGGHVRIMR